MVPLRITRIEHATHHLTCPSIFECSSPCRLRASTDPRTGHEHACMHACMHDRANVVVTPTGPRRGRAAYVPPLFVRVLKPGTKRKVHIMHAPSALGEPSTWLHAYAFPRNHIPRTHMQCAPPSCRPPPRFSPVLPLLPRGAVVLSPFASPPALGATWKPAMNIEGMAIHMSGGPKEPQAVDPSSSRRRPFSCTSH